MSTPKVLIYVLFTLGGVSALIYEVMWMRSFRLVFGSSAQSAAAVLAAYFAGMALGNLLGVRLARRGRPLFLYGLAELAIGLTALAVGPWLALFRYGYPDVYAAAQSQPAIGVAIKLLLAAIALAPPTIAMGVTLPLVVRAIAPGAERTARATSLLYASNVLGATLGAALAGFVLPNSLGVTAGVYLAVAINLAVGLTALGIARVQREARPAAMAAEPARFAAGDGSGQRLWPLVLAAIVSGFGTLALEVLYVRILSFRTEGSVYTFGMMLVVFLLCLAVGAILVSWIGDRRDLWRLLAGTQTAAMISILLMPVLFEFAWALTYSESDSLASRLSKFAIVSVCTLGAPVILVGIVLPATWKLAARDAGQISSCVGRLVAWNTVAAVAGSLLTGFVLLPRLGIGRSLVVVAALYGSVAAGAFLRGYRGFGRWLGCAACLTILIAWYASGAWRFELITLAEGETLLRYRDGAGASVAVTQHAGGQRVLKMNHNYTLGSSASAARELRQGRLPLMLHPMPRRVAFIGVATGITISAALDFPVERAVAVELVPEVSEALADFRVWNRAVYDDPRVELVVEDGRNYLLGTSQQFDVITSDLFIPWHAGTGDLYTVEHFRTAARRLAEGGIFAQWLPGYQLTVEEVRSIVASLQEVFPAVFLWRNDFDLDQPLLCLVCYQDAARLDPASLAPAARRFEQGQVPGDLYLSSTLGIGMLYVAADAELRPWATGAPLNTDDHPYIEFATPGSYFQHRQLDVADMNRFLAGFRPRKWGYPSSVLDQQMDTAIRASDLFYDAQLARQANRFEQENLALLELIPLAAEVPAVVEHVLRVAARYRTRNMPQRSDALLLAMTGLERPPLAALVALAEVRRQDAKQSEAIDLLSQAIERVPEDNAIRRTLLDLLKQSGQYNLIEGHLHYMLKSKPDDPNLRLDLAQAMDRQGKTKEAAEEVAQFRQLRLGNDRRNAWRYLRSLGLGKYVDEIPAIELNGPAAVQPDPAASSSPN